jgi:hypothetical protein
MPSGFVTSFAEGLGNWFLQGASAPTLPSSWSLGLLSTAPAADGSGYVEVTGSGISRVTLARNATNFPKTAAATYQNGGALSFGTATGTISAVQVGLFDAASGGSLKAFAALDRSYGFSTGGAVVIPAHAATFSLLSAFPTGLTLTAAEGWGDAVFQGATLPTYPASWSFALFTAKAGLDGVGGTEVSDSGYARASVIRNSTNFPKTGNVVWQNGGSISFGQAAASYTPLQAGIFDGSGNLVLVGDMDSPGAVPPNATVAFPANGFTFKLVRAHTVTLAWDPSGDPSVTGYKIKYGMASGGPYIASHDAGLATSYLLTELTEGFTYYITITAVNPGGESLVGNEVFQAV